MYAFIIFHVHSSTYIKEYIGGLLGFKEFYGCRAPDYSMSAIRQYLSLNGVKVKL